MCRVQAPVRQPSPGTHTLGAATSGKRLAGCEKSSLDTELQRGSEFLLCLSHEGRRWKACVSTSTPLPCEFSIFRERGGFALGRGASEGRNAAAEPCVDHHKHFLRDYQLLITSPKTGNPPESNYLQIFPLLHSICSLNEHTKAWPGIWTPALFSQTESV